MAFSVNIGNMTLDAVRDVIDALPVTMAKVVPALGYWRGSWEDAVQVTVYDDVPAEEVLDMLGRLMPAEEGFGLDETYWPNPHYEAGPA